MDLKHGKVNNELHVTKASVRRTRVDDGRESGSESSYLVDPASSHMLVSKIKPCMSNLFDDAKERIVNWGWA
jgi:hypothetical protein